MSGHVFVVHGKIEQLTHDAAVIPVDGSLSFNRIWEPLLGQPWPTAPSTWSKGWGRIDGAEQWLVQVADGDYSLVLERLSNAVDDVASQRLKPMGGRERPLVALPVLGIGRGGHRHEQGRVLKLLVDHLHGLAESTGLDFALVTPEASVFAAAQYRPSNPCRLAGHRPRGQGHWQPGTKRRVGPLPRGGHEHACRPAFLEGARRTARCRGSRCGLRGVPGSGCHRPGRAHPSHRGQDLPATSRRHRPDCAAPGTPAWTPCRSWGAQRGDDELRPLL